MAQFTPYTFSKDPSSYLGYSQEISVPKYEGDTSAGLALSGAANVADVSIKALDEVNKLSIEKDLSSRIKAERQSDTDAGLETLGGVRIGPGSAAGVDPGAYEVGGASPYQAEANATSELPSAIVNGERKMLKIAQANKQGKVDDVQYYGNMQAITQELISKNPGYEDYITDRATHLLGTNAANAQRRAIQNSLLQLYGAKNGAEQKWITEMHTDGKYLGEAGMKDALTATNDPVKQANIRAFIAGQKANEHSTDRATKELDAELKSGQVSVERATRVANLGAGNLVSSIINGITFAGSGFTGKFADLQANIQKAQREGQPLDPETQKNYGLVIGQMKDTFSNAYDQMIMDPKYNSGKDSLASISKDPTKLAETKKFYMSQFDTLAKHVNEGNLTLATATMTTIKNMKDSATLRVLGIPTIATAAGVEGALGQSAATFLNNAMQQDSWKKLGQVGKDLNTLWSQDVLKNGDKTNNLSTSIEVWKKKAQEDGSRADTNPDPEYIRQNVEIIKQAVTSKDTDITTKVNAAKVLSNAETTNFIQQFKKNEQFDVWATLYDPQVTKTIKSQLPQAEWDRYKTTGINTFVRLFQTYRDTINQGVLDNRGLNVRFNEATGQLDYDKTIAGRALPPGTERPKGAFASDPSQQAIDRLNRGLGVLKNILDADGQKLTPETMKQIGLDLGGESPNNRNLFKDIYRALTYTNKDTSGSNTPKLFGKGDKGTSTSSDPLPYDLVGSRQGTLKEFLDSPDGKEPPKGLTIDEFKGIPSNQKKYLDDGTIAVNINGSWYRAVSTYGQKKK